MHTSANTCRERTGVGGANDHDTRAAHAGGAFGAQTLAPLLQVPVQVGVGFHLLHLALVDPFGLPANGYRRASPRVDLLTLSQSAPAHRTDAPSPERLRYSLRIAAKLEGVCGGGSERKETNRKLSFEELEGLAARNFGAENLGEASLKGDCHDVIVHLQPQLLARL